MFHLMLHPRDELALLGHGPAASRVSNTSGGLRRSRDVVAGPGPVELAAVDAALVGVGTLIGVQAAS